MSDDIKVLGISGSLRSGSYNSAALQEAIGLVPPGMSIELADISGIPLYNEDVYALGFPPAVERFREQIRAADALLFATPEYNYSMAGVLKNAIDWASRPPEQPFSGKPAAILGASAGRFGTARAQYHLRQTLVFLDVHPLNKPEVMISSAQNAFDAQGRLLDDKAREPDPAAVAGPAAMGAPPARLNASSPESLNMSNTEERCDLSSSRDCPERREHLLQRVTARAAEIGGGITVSRLMPSRQRRMIGAWCFLDHAGPAEFEPGGGLAVGPHPHIGLQTFTWMIQGEALHRDSLGNVQVIRPGQVNLMTAGHGIAHTEESLPDERHAHAAQLWIALPYEQRDIAPAFDHHPDLPRWQEQGVTFTLLAGALAGRQAPCRLYSPLLGADLACHDASTLQLTLDPHFEYGLLPLEGGLEVGGEHFAVNELAYLGDGRDGLQLQLDPGARVLLLGGAPFGAEIFMWWNFVGHSKGEIARAQKAWEEGMLASAGSTPWKGRA